MDNFGFFFIYTTHFLNKIFRLNIFDFFNIWRHAKKIIYKK